MLGLKQPVHVWPPVHVLPGAQPWYGKHDCLSSAPACRKEVESIPRRRCLGGGPVDRGRLPHRYDACVCEGITKIEKEVRWATLVGILVTYLFTFVTYRTI